MQSDIAVSDCKIGCIEPQNTYFVGIYDDNTGCYRGPTPILYPIVSEKVITNNEAESYYQAKRYRLTSIIPLVENPKKVVRELTQEQLDKLLEGYHEYAEFIVELVEIPSNG